jgi:hypothetical protein
MQGIAAAAPEWAPAMRPGELAAFTRAVKAELARRGAGYDLDGPRLRVTHGLPPGLYGLWILAERCLQIHPREWAEEIRDHFDAAVAAQKAAEALAENVRQIASSQRRVA